MAPRDTFQMRTPPKVRARMEALVERSDATDLTDLMRRALATYEMILDEQLAGSTVLFERQGTETRELAPLGKVRLAHEHRIEVADDGSWVAILRIHEGADDEMLARFGRVPIDHGVRLDAWHTTASGHRVDEPPTPDLTVSEWLRWSRMVRELYRVEPARPHWVRPQRPARPPEQP